MRLFKKLFLFLMVFIILFAFLHVPVNTKQAVDHALSTKKIPLYVKMCGFWYRDYMYRDLSSQITKNIKNDRNKIIALFDWTVQNIKKQPEGFQVIDDHIWDIIARRYGRADQMSDVFVTLASYAGYGALWIRRHLEEGETDLVLSFINFDNKWHMFDVYNKRPFISGKELDIAIPGGRTYGEYKNGINDKIFKMHVRRADKQKPLQRIIYELKNFITTLRFRYFGPPLCFAKRQQKPE